MTTFERFIVEKLAFFTPNLDFELLFELNFSILFLL